jgi:putative Mg2+ transporter-C (MgtC) family protein
MSYLYELINSTEINTGTALLRLGFSFIAGAIIGFERETHHELAGLKTHMLICVGSTLLMLLSIYIPQTYTNFQNGDPGRIAAQVVTGVGFIGAGAILRMGINVKGLTTAASIWAIAAIGLVIGAGMYLPAIISIVLFLFVLIIVEQLEKRFFTPISIKLLSIKTSSPETDKNVQSILEKKHLRVIEINPTFHKGVSFGFTYKIGSSNRLEWVNLTNLLIETDPHIFEVEIYDPLY